MINKSDINILLQVSDALSRSSTPTELVVEYKILLDKVVKAYEKKTAKSAEIIRQKRKQNKFYARSMTEKIRYNQVHQASN